MYRHAIYTSLALIAAGIIAWGWFEYSLFKLSPPPLKSAEEVSVTVVDRNDRLLRAFTTADGRWRLATTL